MKMKIARFARGSRPSFAQDERGLSTVEYVILLVLIVAGCVALWNKFGGVVQERLKGAHTEFDTEVQIQKTAK